jgi:hypothetical protein
MCREARLCGPCGYKKAMVLHCSGPGSALVVTFTPSAARACAVMGETTPVRITL